MTAKLAPYAVLVDWKNPPRLVFLAVEVPLGVVDAAIASHCEAVFDVYVVDPVSYTYCCELTPSFFLRHVCTTPWATAALMGDESPEGEAALEAVHEAFSYDGNDCDAYVHAWRVAGGLYGTPIAAYATDDPDETLSESIECAIEWYQGNPKL